MTVAILIVSAISFFQDHRSRVALRALQQLTAPHARVIRDGEVREIDAEDIVIGDLIVAEEGHLVPADGRILQSADFSLNESMLTRATLFLSVSCIRAASFAIVVVFPTPVAPTKAITF